MNEISKTLYLTLSGGTALTSLLAGTTSIYHLQAPDDAELPFVTFNIQAGGDENQTPKRRKNNLYYIRAYSETSALNAGSIDAEVDNLLDGQTLSVSGWTNIWSKRENDIEIVETLPNGKQVWTIGGFYRLRNEQN